jgi:hypothetical protein
VQDGIEAQQLFLLALEQARDGHAGPARDDLGDFVGGDFLLHERAFAFLAGLLDFVLGVLERFSFCGDLAVAELGDAVEIVGALGLVDLARTCSSSSRSLPVARWRPFRFATGP